MELSIYFLNFNKKFNFLNYILFVFFLIHSFLKEKMSKITLQF